MELSDLITICPCNNINYNGQCRNCDGKNTF